MALAAAGGGAKAAASRRAHVVHLRPAEPAKVMQYAREGGREGGSEE